MDWFKVDRALKAGSGKGFLQFPGRVLCFLFLARRDGHADQDISAAVSPLEVMYDQAWVLPGFHLS